ncbi:MAG: sigma 54-interacting transcriptional regulator [Phycisphaerales bacterium]
MGAPRPSPGNTAPKEHEGASRAPDDAAALEAIVRGTAAAVGDAFFRSLVKHLAEATGAKYAFIAEFRGGHQVATHGYWFRDHFTADVEWDVRGTPCEDVIAGALCHHPSGVSRKFPSDKPLVDLGIDSYLGVPLRDADGATLGHLAVFDDRPMPDDPRRTFIFRIFAERATAELLRLRAEQRLHDSEVRFRDLFDEAPIAYVHEGLDSKFVRANKTAMRILGITPEQVNGTYGTSFIPETPEAQRRLKEAFESINRGIDTSGVTLELRRRSDGQPVWIQWWSRPDPSGTFTRTMFIDITDKVLMEKEQARLREQNSILQDDLRAAGNFGEIVGKSQSLAAVLADARRVAPTDSTVLIQGETGTGKELIARAIHEQSARRGGPFVKVNCAALPAGLVESEFFGHEKGAFTGAAGARKGRFEIADGGTIFLDEVGEVSPEVQVKLLRVLQESEFERVGGNDTIKVNVRVIAATNRDLGSDAKAGTFRPDLFYRLNVFPITMPPLRERAEDVGVLAMYFAAQLAPAMGKKIDRFADGVLQRLKAYHWPGNVRELRNVIERALILSEGGVLNIDDRELGAGAKTAAPTTPGLSTGPAGGQSLADIERHHILAVLKQTGGVVGGPKGAAKVLGVPPSTLRSTMARLGIS